MGSVFTSDNNHYNYIYLIWIEETTTTVVTTNHRKANAAKAVHEAITTIEAVETIPSPLVAPTTTREAEVTAVVVDTTTTEAALAAREVSPVKSPLPAQDLAKRLDLSPTTSS